MRLTDVRTESKLYTTYRPRRSCINFLFDCLKFQVAQTSSKPPHEKLNIFYMVGQIASNFCAYLRHMSDFHIFSRPYFNSGRAIGMVVVRLSVTDVLPLTGRAQGETFYTINN